MAEIDAGIVFRAVISAIAAAYPECAVYGETVDQGLESGSFNVIPVTVTASPGLGARGSRAPLFDVIYYLSGDGGRDDALEVSAALPDILESFETENGDVVHGEDFQCEFTDDAMHCRVRVPFSAYRPTSGDTMNQLSMEVSYERTDPF